MTARIEIDVTAIGTGKIVVDGEDLSDRVVGFELRCYIGQLSRLTVYMNNVQGPVTAAAEVEKR